MGVFILNTESLKHAIDMAAKTCTTRRDLAQRLGISPSHLANIEARRKPMPVAAAMRLAELLDMDGEQARRLLAMVEVENPTRTEAEAVWLRRVLFQLGPLGVALALLQPATSDARNNGVNDLHRFTVYTLWSIANALRAALRRAARREFARPEAMAH